MRQQISFLTQSRFYSPAFNAAIFDGPVRIYFAQYQEVQALKVYFDAQERLKDINSLVRDAFRRMGVNIFIMLYPTLETFQISFKQEVVNTSQIFVDRIGADFVIGAAADMVEQNVNAICDHIHKIASELAATAPLQDALTGQPEELPGF